LEEIAAPVRARSRISKEIVEQVILKLCSEDYLPLRTLADLLKREPDSIRNHYVNPMLKQGLLEARYPNEPTHPQQAYRTLSPPEISQVSDTP
jgi:ATP-dependent DNA helicase RecG